MTSLSTGSLAGSDLDYAINAFKVRTEGRSPTPVPVYNAVSLIVKILVGTED